MKYLINIESFDHLKKLYREMAMKLHPDCGGSDEEMKVLNAEYDTLFPIWKNRAPKEEANSNETADSDRIYFYTQNGWAGSNFSRRRTTKEITEIIRSYVKEVYSDCKWSVRFSSYAGGASISVNLMEAPYNVFVDESQTRRQLNQYYLDRDESLVPKAKAMMVDVKKLIESYRYDDSDAMIDYFDTNFYYDIGIGSYEKPFKVVYREPKKKDDRQYETVVVKEKVKKTRKVAKEIERPTELKPGQLIRMNNYFSYGVSKGYIYKIESVTNVSIMAMKMGRKLDKTVTSSNVRGNTFWAKRDNMEKWLDIGAVSFVEIVDETYYEERERTVKRPVKAETSIDGDTGFGEYEVKEDIDTRDNTKIWVVKFAQKLERDAYKELAARMRTIGGFYSRFKKGFLFREDPTEKLKTA